MVFLKSDPTKIPTTLEEKTRGAGKLEYFEGEKWWWDRDAHVYMYRQSKSGNW